MQDIREFKKNLRAECKNYRKGIPADDKARMDRSIAQKVLSLYQYRQATQVFCYVSTDIEVDTTEILTAAFRDGKKVAAPRCVPKTRIMEFVQISSLEDLTVGSYGIPEPKAELTKLLSPNSRTLCIVPALMYDFGGYRLGYGGGYYDRFLNGFTGTAVGVIYAKNVAKTLRRGKFDIPVNLFVTEKYLRRCAVNKIKKH